VCWRAIAQARRERSRPSRPLHRPRQLLQRSGNAAAGLLRPRNQVTVVAPRQPSAIRCLPWQPAERSTKSLPLVRGLARTMSARPSPGTSGQAASKSATGSYTQAKRQRRRNTQRSDSAVNGRSRSSVTADRKVELTASLGVLTARAFRIVSLREPRQVPQCFHCARRFPKAINVRFDRRHRADPASDRLCYRALPRADRRERRPQSRDAEPDGRIHLADPDYARHSRNGVKRPTRMKRGPSHSRRLPWKRARYSTASTPRPSSVCAIAP